MTDLATMLRQQMESTIASQLDAAVATGDAQTARKIAKQYADLQVASVPRAATKTAPTKEQIFAALTAKAPWFGIDPKKSALVGELGKTMLPERFDTAEAFADALLQAVEEQGKPVTAASGDDEDVVEDDDDADADEAERKPRKNGTAAPELNSGSRSNTATSTKRAFETGDIKHLPKSAADEINRAADKLARNGTKEQRAAFIKSAVIARARGDLIATGKFDAKSGKLK